MVRNSPLIQQNIMMIKSFNELFQRKVGTGEKEKQESLQQNLRNPKRTQITQRTQTRK